MLKIRWLIAYIMISGCTTLQIPNNFRYQKISTADFDFATWQKIENPQAVYKIYIEGDGYAFNADGQPTNNPTPRGTLMREIAFSDNSPNVVYMARACQFVQHKKCAQKYWTTARFAQEVVDSQASAVKQTVQNQPVTFIGFSGGAQIAGLIAVTHPEIKVQEIITVAGNLDHSAWTTYHKVPALAESMDLNDYRTEFSALPQVHYVGTDDEVMPPFLNTDFVADKNTVIKVKGATHNSGWQQIFTDIHAK